MQTAQDTEVDAEELDEVDLAWQRQRGKAAPLAFGVAGIALSPLLLGLILGPMAMRTGLDRWRSGLRRPVVAVGIASGFTAVVLSIVAALLWGSVLATVLLGRDALREAEKWRGQQVEAAEVATTVGAEPPARIALRPRAGDPRMILVAVDIGQGPSQELVRSLVERIPATLQVLLVDRGGEGAPLAPWAAENGLRLPVVPRDAVLPAPLDAIAALPMIVSIDADGRIEGALVGVRPAQELDALLGGKMALPPMAR